MLRVVTQSSINKEEYMFTLEQKRSYVGKIIKFNALTCFPWRTKDKGFNFTELLDYSESSMFFVVGINEYYQLILKPLCLDRWKLNIDRIPLEFNECLNCKHRSDLSMTIID